ncbi:unnamed protein product [Orchesella dallaii]|uniref:C2H2-type domain-containing protein n=1 Tax=Orchesella dallaii TaxID=48710 RepID=A0ABP1S1R0_9HEXA
MNEKVTDCESDQEMSRKEEKESRSSKITSNSEEENEDLDEKPLVSGPCLLCAHCVGERQQQQMYTHQELFTSFCKILGIKPKPTDDKPCSIWNFEKEHVFPFCEMCKVLLSSLVNVYSKLEELELVIKEKMMEGEWKYVEEELYSSIDERYLIFRTKALNGNESHLTFDLSRTQSDKDIRKANHVTNLPRDCPEIVPVSNFQSRKRSNEKEVSYFTNSIEAVSGHNSYGENHDDNFPSTFFVSDSPFHSSSDCDSDSDFEAVSNPKYSRVMGNVRKATSRKHVTSKSVLGHVSKSSSSSFESKSKSSDTIAFIYEQRLTPAGAEQKSGSAPKLYQMNVAEEVAGKCRDTKSDYNVDLVKLEAEEPNVESKAAAPRIRIKQTKNEAAKKSEKASSKPSPKKKRDQVIINDMNINNEESDPIQSGPGIISPPPPIDAPFNCQLCWERPGFLHKKLLHQHLISVHKIQPKDYSKMYQQLGNPWCVPKRYHTANGFVIECDICAKPFPNCLSKEWKAHKISHMGVHEKKFGRGKRLRENCCRLCLNTPEFSSFELMHEHCVMVHGITKRKKYANMVDRMKRMNHDGRTRYHTLNGWVTECDICGRPFTKCREMKWNNHLWSHLNDEEKEECLLKNKGGRGIGWNLLRPTKEQLEKGQMVPCPKCGQFVRSGESLDAHLKSHEVNDKRERIVCSLCGKSFLGGLKALTIHMEKAHPGGVIRAYKCCFPSCDKEFDEEESLQEHVEEEHGNSEENRKRRMCDQCGRVMANRWFVKGHKLVHTRERLFSCDICNKKFAKGRSLNQHMATVHRMGKLYGNFKCEHVGCGRVFPLQVYLSTHVKKSHGISENDNTSVTT